MVYTIPKNEDIKFRKKRVRKMYSRKISASWAKNRSDTFILCNECTSNEQWDCEGNFQNIYVSSGCINSDTAEEKYLDSVNNSLAQLNKNGEAKSKSELQKQKIKNLKSNAKKVCKSNNIFEDFCIKNKYFNIDSEFLEKLVITNKLKIDQLNCEGESLLLFAAFIGNYNLAKILLEKGLNVEYSGKLKQNSPLLTACMMGHVDIVKLLLSYNANVNKTDHEGNSALFLASYIESLEIIKLLVAAGARLIAFEDNSNFELMESLCEGNNDNAQVSNYTNGEKDQDTSSSSVETKETPLSIACFNGNYEIVKLLLEEGSKYGLRQDELFISLIEASVDGHVEIAKLLLDYGADLSYCEKNCDTPLSLASNGGHLEFVRLLLNHGANIEETNEEGVTPLMEASREGFLEVVKLLLAYNAEVNTITEESSETALTFACGAGWYDIVVTLIQFGASIELGSPTPLIEACSAGHLNIVQYLLSSGANVNTVTSTFETALITASDGGHLEIVQLLINNGAEVDYCNYDGYSALMKAARGGHVDVVKLLSKYNIDINRQSRNNDATVLSCACISGNISLVKFLLQHGADPLHIFKDNSTVLMEASRGGFVFIAMLLLDPSLIWSDLDPNTITKQQELPITTLPKDAKKLLSDNTAKPAVLPITKSKQIKPPKKSSKQRCHSSSSNNSLSRKASPTSTYSSIDINSYSDDTNDTALTIACTSGHYDMAIFLIKRGAYIEHKDKRGYTPLMICSFNGSIKICNILLEIGANIEAFCDKNHDTALTLACSTGRFDIVKILIEHGANIEHHTMSDLTPLCLASNHGHLSIITYLLNKGADVNPQLSSAKHGLTPLMLASMHGHINIVRLLLEKNANPSVEINKNTALSLACTNGKMDVVNILINHKANIEHRSKNGLTPLMEAANNGHIDVGAALIKAGADINASTNQTSRETPLSLASEKGHDRFVELLLKNKANIEFKNKRGCTALWLAASNGHLKTVKILHNYGAYLNVFDGRDCSALVAAFRRGHSEVVRYLVQKVSHFPSDNECKKVINSITDKNIQSKASLCYQIIMQEKLKQEKEADKNATDFLKELSLEKVKKEDKKVAQTKKKDKKKKKKMKSAAEPNNIPISVTSDSTNQKAEPDVIIKSSFNPIKNIPEVTPTPSPNILKPKIIKSLLKPILNININKEASEKSGSDSEDWKEVTRKSGSVKLVNIRKTVKTQIPSALVSRFIGKGGSSINLIREATHTSVEIDTSKKSSNGDCTIIIKGFNKDIKSVLAILHSIINEPERSTQSIVNDLDPMKRVPTPHTNVVNKEYHSSVPVNIPPPVLMSATKQNKPAVLTNTNNTIQLTAANNISYPTFSYQNGSDALKRESPIVISTQSKPVITTTSIPQISHKREASSNSSVNIIPVVKREPSQKLTPFTPSSVVWSTAADVVNTSDSIKLSSNTFENSQSNYNIQYPSLIQNESVRVPSQQISVPPKSISLCPGANRPPPLPIDIRNYNCPLYELLTNGKHEVGVKFDKFAWNLTSILNKPSSSFIANILKNGIDVNIPNDTDKDSTSKDSFFVNTTKPFDTFQPDLNNNNEKGQNSTAPSWFGGEESPSHAASIDIESFFINKQFGQS